MIGVCDISVDFGLLGVLRVLILPILAPLGVVFASEGATVSLKGSELLREQLFTWNSGEHAVIAIDF